MFPPQETILIPPGKQPKIQTVLNPVSIIRHHCNGGRFGPPWGFTPTSTCSWIGHLVSGLLHATLYALFRLALASPPVLNTLSLPRTITRRTVLQKVPHHTLTYKDKMISLKVEAKSFNTIKF